MINEEGKMGEREREKNKKKLSLQKEDYCLIRQLGPSGGRGKALQRSSPQITGLPQPPPD